MAPSVYFSHISKEDDTVKLEKKRKPSCDKQDGRNCSIKRKRKTFEVVPRVSESTLITEKTQFPSTVANSISGFIVLPVEDRPDDCVEASTQRQRIYLVQATGNDEYLDLAGIDEQTSLGSPSVLEASVDERILAVFTGVLEASVDERQPPTSVAHENLPESIPQAFTGVQATVFESWHHIYDVQDNFSESAPSVFTYRPSWNEPANCPVCRKYFRRRVEMDRHLRTTHSNERSHACIHCAKTFKLSHHLKQHIISFHEMLHCPEYQCTYKSSRKGDLLRH